MTFAPEIDHRTHLARAGFAAARAGTVVGGPALRRGQAAILHLVGLRAARLQQELPRRPSGRRRGLDLRRRRRRLHQGQGRLPARRRASLLRQGGALEQGRPAAADRHQAHQELGFDLPGLQEPARPAGRRRQGLDGAVGLGQHLDPLPHRPGQEPGAELEPACGTSNMPAAWRRSTPCTTRRWWRRCSPASIRST